MISLPSPHPVSLKGKCRSARTNLRDALLVLPAEENGPCDPAGVLALEEEGLGLSVLETEDLGVTADVELALYHASAKLPISRLLPRPRRIPGVLYRSGGGFGILTSWKAGGRWRVAARRTLPG